MKIGEAHWTQSSSLKSVNTIGALMHPAPIVMADRTRKKIIGEPCLVSFTYWRRGTSVRQYIGTPMPPRHYYWGTDPDPPCANSISAPKKKHLAGAQSKQSARLSLQSSELGPPNPLNRRWVCPPFVPGGGHTCLPKRGWVGSQFQGTYIVVL